MSTTRQMLCLFALVGSTGCLTWRPMAFTAGVTPVVDGSHPVRATRLNGAKVILYSPRVLGDSLIGEEGSLAVRTALALRDVRELQVLRVSAGRTAAAAGAGIGAGAIIALAAMVMLIFSGL